MENPRETVNGCKERWGDEFIEAMDDITTIHRLLYRVSRQSVSEVLRELNRLVERDAPPAKVRPEGKVVPLFPREEPQDAWKVAAESVRRNHDEMSRRLDTLESDLADLVIERAAESLPLHATLARLGLFLEDVNIAKSGKKCRDIPALVKDAGIIVRGKPESRITIYVDGNWEVKALVMTF